MLNLVFLALLALDSLFSLLGLSSRSSFGTASRRSSLGASSDGARYSLTGSWNGESCLVSLPRCLTKFLQDLEKQCIIPAKQLAKKYLKILKLAPEKCAK